MFSDRRDRSDHMEKPWSATIAILVTVIAAIAAIYLGDRGNHSDQNFYFSGHANYIDRSILVFAAIVRLAIAATATIVAIVVINVVVQTSLIFIFLCSRLC